MRTVFETESRSEEGNKLKLDIAGEDLYVLINNIYDNSVICLNPTQASELVTAINNWLFEIQD